MRKKLIAGNWKMNGSKSFNVDWFKGFNAAFSQLGSNTQSDVMVCAPSPYLSQMSALLEGTQVALGAQDVSAHVKGAYTGEISLGMLEDLGVQGVIIGHSERRAYHAESDEMVGKKVQATVSSTLMPIVCLGETQAQRLAGLTNSVIAAQLKAVTDVLEQDFDRLVIAYEPVWAIGTGLTASPEQAQEVHAFIRAQLSQKTCHANALKILYGGSMNAQNASSLLGLPDVDGGLIGGASLMAQDFVNIIHAAGSI
ncbi:MAG: triose-phosphate isomerase [Burkholderiaceae bacterium]